jgi:hypothetical protein
MDLTECAQCGKGAIHQVLDDQGKKIRWPHPFHDPVCTRGNGYAANLSFLVLLTGSVWSFCVGCFCWKLWVSHHRGCSG